MPKLEILRVRDQAGNVHTTWLSDEGGLLYEDAAGPRPVAAAHIDAVFTRYGKALGVAIPPSEGDHVELTLPDGAAGRVRTFRFRGFGDVEPSDYLLLEVDGREAMAGLATLVASALGHLVRASVGQA